MRFRRRKASDNAEEESGLEQEPVDFEPAPPPDAGRHRWSTAFLVVGSAMAGATALALWNRRTIENMRAQIQAQPEPQAPAPRQGDEIV